MARALGNGLVLLQKETKKVDWKKSPSAKETS
jgi:hypothetical protein